MGLFARKPISDLQPVEGAHSLKRALGAGDLIMLAIGAVIGAGIFSSIGTAAAGEIRPDGTIIRAGAEGALQRVRAFDRLQIRYGFSSEQAHGDADSSRR